MNIGQVIMNERGIYTGRIATLALSLQVYLRPAARTNDRAPHFDVLARNVAGDVVAIGALWEKTAAETGEVYYSGRIEDPSLTAPLYIVAFSQPDGSLNITWTRPNRAAGAMKARTTAAGEDELAQAPGYSGGEGDGLGESTAPDAKRGRRNRAAAGDEVAF